MHEKIIRKISWSQSNLFCCWYYVRLFMFNRRIIWPSCKCWAIVSKLELEESV